MTAKQRAEDLIVQFLKLDLEPYEQKKCALITVKELINSHSQDYTDNQYYFWLEVKKEIESK